MIKEFDLSPMDTSIKVITTVLLVLPVVFVLGSVVVSKALFIPTVIIIVLFLWVWLWFRPQRFDITPDSLLISWPLRNRQIPRSEIIGVEILTSAELTDRVGVGLRVGSGGLWGGFGWLWTTKRGFIRMYISRLDRCVWFETSSGQPWIITPDRPEDFVNALSH